ncbi:MAG: NDP-sugar synthase [Methanomassiliicoccus sp.]|nr:NDP-sugar synthase [Methanomassiliicoccus sp.]
MSEDITAVILAGGEGTRLRPLTSTRPKPLLPILGRPCVEYVIRSLVDAEVGRAFLTCGYRSQDMVDQLGNGRQFGLEMRFAFEDHPAGTAGAVKLLEKELKGTIVVVSGDVLADVDIRSLVAMHRRTGALATMALTTVDRPEEFGIVGLDDDGRIVRFKEKPRTEEVFSNLINAGIYVLEERALQDIPEGEKFDFSKQLFPKLLERSEPLYGMPISGLWKDIGRPHDLLDANIRMAERKGTTIQVPGASCSGRIVATRFEAQGCEINGPAYIGEGTVIGPRASLTRCAVGGQAAVGEGTAISDSFLMGGCTLGPDCTVQGSLMGQGCRIGQGVSIINSVLGDGIVLDGPITVEGRTLE